MAKFPLGFDLNIQTLDEQFGVAAEPPQERPDDILVTTLEDMTTEEAKNRVLETSNNSLYEVFLRGYQTGKSADQLAQEVASNGIKRDDILSNKEFVAEQGLTLDDYEYSATESRIAANMQVAQEITQNRMQAIGEEKSMFGRGLDVADRFLRAVSPIGVFEDITADTESNSRIILDNAAKLSPAEFKVWFEGYADEVGKEGIFRENTLSAFEELSGEIAGAGFDPMKGSNQLFAAVDVATSFTLGVAVKGVKNLVKPSLKSSTAVGRVTAIKGPEAGSEAATKILERAPDPVALNNVAPSVLDVAPQPVRVPQAAFTEQMVANKITRDMNDMFQKGAFGRVATKKSINDAALKIVERRKTNVANPVFDFKYFDEGLGNYVTAVRFGRAMDGAPFKPLANGEAPESLKRHLEDIKTRAPEAEIVPVNPDDLRQGYVVEVKERINTSGLQEAIDEVQGLSAGWVRNTVGRVMNNPLMGSTALRDVQRLETLNNMGESARAAVKQYVLNPYLRAMESLSPKETYTIQRVYGELRDGSDAARRTRYDESEFRTKYIQLHPSNAEPSPKAFEAFQAVATVEEADYLIKSTNMLQRYIEKGFNNTIQVFDDYFAPAKTVARSDIPADARIIDGASGVSLRLDELGDEDLPIWKIDKPTDSGQEYVITPKKVRMIDPTDVMGYNPGGSRVNPLLNYFVVLGGKRLKSLMGAFSEKQARLAKEQLTNLKKAIETGSIDDAIVRANNDWNPGIQTADELRKFMDDEGWDFTKGDINVKGRNDDIIDVEVDGEGVFVGLRADDYIQNDLRRNDKVLLDFGGGRAYNEDPVNSVLSQFGQSAFTYSNRAYSRNAMVGWVKRVQQSGRGWLPANVSPNNYEELFRKAEVTGTDEFSRRMKELKEITERKLNMKDDFALTMEGYGQVAAEFIFDKTSDLGKRGVPFLKGGIKLDLAGDPSNIFLKIGFQSAFGFFNAAQIFLQSFHATTIMAISPIHGFKGAALVPAMRGAINAYEKGAGQEAIKRFAKAAEISEKEAEEWFEYIRTSGRAVVEGDAIEDGTAIGWGISGWKGENLEYGKAAAAKNLSSKYVGKALDAGVMPFQFGERLTRLTAMNTAILEFKAKYPGVSLFSDQARSVITRREQDLTFNMNSSARARVQSGFMKVPTQWLSYSFRASEAVFVGRNFTPAERARLTAILMPFYGLAGFGLASSADYVADKLGIEPGGALYMGLKNGVLDGLFAALGTDLSVGQRLAPAGAFFDVYKNLTEGKFLEVVGGPSGQIGQGLYEATMSALSSLKTGQTASLTEDVIQILRTPSGVDNVAKAIGIFNNGIYRSKTGVALPFEMTVSEGVTALLGFAPQRVTEFYNRKSDMFADTKKFGTFRKEVNRDAERIFQLLEGDSNDIDQAIRLFEELNVRITFSGFSLTDQLSLRKSATSKLESEWLKLQDHLIRQDNMYGLQAMQSIFNGSNE
jgi:hypothetical protein